MPSEREDAPEIGLAQAIERRHRHHQASPRDALAELDQVQVNARDVELGGRGRERQPACDAVSSERTPGQVGTAGAAWHQVMLDAGAAGVNYGSLS